MSKGNRLYTLAKVITTASVVSSIIAAVTVVCALKSFVKTCKEEKARAAK